MTIAPRLGIDSFGEPLYGAPVAYRVRITGASHRTQSNTGEEIIADRRIYFATTPTIGPHDLLTLSTEDAGSTETGARQPAIANLGRLTDDLGRAHIYLDVTPWRTAFR